MYKSKSLLRGEKKKSPKKKSRKSLKKSNVKSLKSKSKSHPRRKSKQNFTRKNEKDKIGGGKIFGLEITTAYEKCIKERDEAFAKTPVAIAAKAMKKTIADDSDFRLKWNHDNGYNCKRGILDS